MRASLLSGMTRNSRHKLYISAPNLETILLQEVLVPFSEKWYLETTDCVQEILIAIRLDSIPRPFSYHSQETLFSQDELHEKFHSDP